MKQYSESFAGAFAGVVGTGLGFPLDTIKTRIQTSQSMSMLSVCKTIYIENGLVGFYRGIAGPMLALTTLNTLNFSSYAYFCSLLAAPKDAFDYKHALAASFAGPIASIVSTPFELVKIQMQINKTGFRSSFDAGLSIVRMGGIVKLYTGHTINTVREVVFLSTYFSIYELTKNKILHVIGNVPFAVALSGGMAGAMGWFVSFPLDSVKSTIQSRDLSKSYNNNSIQMAKEILCSKGISGLYSGVVPSIIRAFLVSSSRFSAYELALHIINSS